MTRILEAHGRVSEHYEAENWDTKPMTVDEYALFYAKELGQEDSYLEKRQKKSSSVSEGRQSLAESEISNQPLHEEGLAIYATQHDAPSVRDCNLLNHSRAKQEDSTDDHRWRALLD